jgi:hypothetical protein
MSSTDAGETQVEPRVKRPIELTLTTRQQVLLAGAAVLLLTVLFGLFPMPGGDDWDFYRSAVQRMLSGQSLYTAKIGLNNVEYHYPPWVAAALLPLGVLPHHWGRALLNALTFGVLVLVARRYKLSAAKQAMLLLSPPMFYILLHGQIDALVLGILLLPEPWRLILSITKPQVSIAFVFGISRKYWLRAVIIAAGVTLASLLVFGLWPLELLRQPSDFIGMGLNIWGGLWPFQVPLGLVLLLRAIERRDDRYLMAASPFFMPYAATSSLIGPWAALCGFLKDWQALLVLLAWWAASFSRLL